MLSEEMHGLFQFMFKEYSFLRQAENSFTIFTLEISEQYFQTDLLFDVLPRAKEI